MSQTTQYTALKHAVRDLLKQNAKTISDGAGKPVGYLECVNPQVAQIPADRFPAVCIYRRTKEADTARAMGGVRSADVTLELTCMVLVNEDAELADNYVEQLAQNVEKVMRDTPKLGLSNVTTSKVGDTTFETVREEDGTSIVAMAQIDLTVTSFMT